MATHQLAMKDASREDKKDVLLAALEERYAAMRTIRERVQSIGVWALGLMLIGAGWLVQSDVHIPSGRKILYIAALGAAGWALYKYLDDLKGGFGKQQSTAVRIEKALGLHTLGIFDDSEDAIYPKEWADAGGKNGKGKFFENTYLLLGVGFGILALAILLQPEYHPMCFYHRWWR